jgi:hypothetical protein
MDGRFTYIPKFKKQSKIQLGVKTKTGILIQKESFVGASEEFKQNQQRRWPDFFLSHRPYK